MRPGGLLSFDICDFEWGEARGRPPSTCRVEEDWAIVVGFSAPTRARFIREITTFVRGDGGTWRRDDETHVNVLLDTAALPALLAGQGVEATVGKAFGDETTPVGLRVVKGRRAG